MKTERTENSYARYFVGINGVKFPVYNKDHNFHKIGVKRYGNIGDNHLEPECFDLPKELYPYTIEWSDIRKSH